MIDKYIYVCVFQLCNVMACSHDNMLILNGHDLDIYMSDTATDISQLTNHNYHKISFISVEL